DHRFQNLAFMIDGAPEIAELAVDLHERLIQMPTPLGIAAHVRDPLLSDLGGKHRAKPIPPKPDRLMADVDPPLGQGILDVAQGLKLPQPKTVRKIALTMPVRVLKSMARKEPVAKIAKALNRTDGATRQKATVIGLSLKLAPKKRASAKKG